VAAKLKVERAVIAENEAKKARLALADDLSQRDRQLADLQQILASNSEKLAEAQKRRPRCCARNAPRVNSQPAVGRHFFRRAGDSSSLDGCQGQKNFGPHHGRMLVAVAIMRQAFF
jgi:hypothetical protein